MQCPRCQHENPAAMEFCGKCGTPLQRPDGSSQPAPSYADVQRSLTEALEQQTATSELLKVIGRSTFDLQPVFETLVENAVRLCEARRGLIYRLDDQVLRVVATHNASEVLRAFIESHPLALARASAAGRASVERRTIHIQDVVADPEYTYGATQVDPVRTVLAIPMLRDNELLGVIVIYRHEIRPFNDGQIALMETFANQAAIAIENVRLFTELQEKNSALTESLGQQTATSEILSVISSSPTDVQPVFTAMAASAARLCEARDTTIFRVDGDVLRLVAHEGPIAPDAVLPLTDATIGGRVIRERRAIHVADMQAAETHDYSISSEFARNRGFRTTLSVPLLHGGQAIGLIAIRRSEVRPFTDRQVELVKTFADQAVIAIENVRLFTELQTSNHDLTAALDTQTATSDILRVISQSPTDVQPVFNAIVKSARRLLDGIGANVARLVGRELHLAAFTATGDDADHALRATYPMPISGWNVAARAARACSPVYLADVETDAEYRSSGQNPTRARGVRSLVAVPMMSQNNIVGTIAVSRREPGSFSDQQIALLQTFADQAVIAIENVRLFTELQTSNRDLTTALDKQTATGEILRVVSQSQTDVQPVFDAIVHSAMRLLRAHSGMLTRIAGDQLELAAFTSIGETYDIAMRTFWPRPLHAKGAHHLAMRDRRPVNIADAASDPRVPEDGRAVVRLRDIRSVVSVPLLRHDEAIGTIAVNRQEPGGFTDDEIALLQTFADQAVIAIENVRLFKELEAANRELAAASQHKSEFLANMSHELRTPLNAIIGFSEVLSERMFGELNEKQEEYSKDIHASGQHLLALINDILDLSKIEAGRMELELTEFDLPTALDNALMLVRERAQRRSLTLHKDVDAGVGQIQGDERKIRQVVLNLLSNAIKFTPEGGRIELAAVPKGGCVKVSVSDTGVGIAPEDQEKVFEEFRQVGTADKKAEGTGLGLTLCRKFIELHGGRIWVRSQLGAGSTFTVTIPVHRGE